MTTATRTRTRWVKPSLEASRWHAVKSQRGGHLTVHCGKRIDEKNCQEWDSPKRGLCVPCQKGLAKTQRGKAKL